VLLWQWLADSRRPDAPDDPAKEGTRVLHLVVPHLPLLAGGSGVAQAQAAFTSLQSDLQKFVLPSATLGAVWGGLTQTHMFHSQQLKETGKEILKYSLVGMFVAGLGPSLLAGLAHTIGLP
jgi:hypothetical protein